MSGQWLAVGAGFCAALASVCAKLAMSPEIILHLCYQMLGSDNKQTTSETATSHICDLMLVYVRFTFFGLIFLFNALMWTVFVKSLQTCSSSLEATVTNTAANFFFTAVIGWGFFHESLSLLWWIGSSLTITGLVLIHRGMAKEKCREAEKKSL
ncbi:hypothetical protein NP493_118g04026 [Ridgeia piscesae]|uniref:Transmembrane protein 42 n=1 Tax=Ridgeia piscesae TaxID=27915 RepID=A0AAD9P6S7_RIDPI|nr:hypothetical protein NP493_118g04026 [Ridgeia piscesae]